MTMTMTTVMEMVAWVGQEQSRRLLGIAKILRFRAAC
jgi:hypothetical protein